MSHAPLSTSARRAPKVAAHRLLHLARMTALAAAALATCEVALADFPHNPVTRSSAAAAQASVQAAPSAARAAEGSHLTWQGRKLEHLVMDSSRLLFSVPLEVNPANAAETGANCSIGQRGPVWYLSGPGGVVNFSVNCTIPAGKAIFLPALAYLYDFPCPDPYPQLIPGQSLEAFLRGLTAEFVDGISFASITLDGKPVKLHRAATGVFPFTGAKDWVKYDACITGAPQLLQADGLWAMIDPPSVGQHAIGLKVTHPWIGTIEGTWNITVGK